MLVSNEERIKASKDRSSREVIDTSTSGTISNFEKTAFLVGKRGEVEIIKVGTNLR